MDNANRRKQVIVIGGGLGGISAAITLQQKGYQVTVFEKNNHLGGKVNRLEKDGFGFDLGPSMLTMPWIFEKLFQNSGKQMDDYVPTIRIEEEWRSFFPDGTIISLYSDLEKMETINTALSDEDMEEYRFFLSYARQLYEASVETYFEKNAETTWEVLKHHGIFKSLKDFDYFSTMQEAIDQRISNPYLRKILGYFTKYVGSSPYDAPAVLSMMIYMQYEQGIWYVPGGMHRLVEGLVKLGKEIGVQFFTGKEVVSLQKKENRITGAVLQDGSVETANYYVSNMEVIPAYKYLLKEEESYLTPLEEKFEPASSGLVLHLGVKKNYPHLGHHNFFFSENPKEHYESIFHKKELPKDPTIYLVNVNKTDPSQTKPGHENIKVLPHIPPIQEKDFTNEEYLKFREEVLIKLETMGLQNLRETIVFEDMWTPKDIQEQYYSHKGAIYGVNANRKLNKGFKHSKKSDRYRNLYFVGGTVNPGGGMPMVTLSGQLAGQMISTEDEQK